jgi:dTMP kinase
VPAGRPGRPAAALGRPGVDLSGVAELRALMRIRPFRRLWLVLSFSSLGDWLGLLATSTFAAQQFTNPAAKGVAFGSVIAVRLLPALVLGPVAGVIADRWNRRYTMVVSDLIRFVMFASIPAVSLITANSKLIVGWIAVATFVIEAVGMAWAPSKDAAVPNLIPKARLETANQLTLASTYGVTPVVAALVLALMSTVLSNAFHPTADSQLNPQHIALYFDALTFLATALVVYFGIKEISGRDGRAREQQPSLARQFVQGWAYVGRTPLVRGLVLGILGAFAGGGVVIGTAQFYARSLGGGDSTFYILFAMIFIGLGVGIVAGPRMIGALSRRRWFGLSIGIAAVPVGLLAVSPHLFLSVVLTLVVGVGAGMAFLSGTTLLGTEVGDEIRGRVFAFVQTAVRVVLMLTIALSGVVVGLGGSRRFTVVGVEFQISSTRLLLLAAGVLGLFAGIAAFRQMDDKHGVPVLADVLSSLRGRPLGRNEPVTGRGLFIVFEGGEGAGKSTQMHRVAEYLRSENRAVVETREPGATHIGERIRQVVLHGGHGVSARAEALLYAADRAHHVATVVRPALVRGAVVISDRYVDSSLAYQGAGRTLPTDDIAWLSAWATGGLKPDLVVLLDIDPTVGLARAGNRGAGADRLERESVEFHERVRYAFLDLAADNPGRYLVLDASRPADELAAEIGGRVDALLPSLPGDLAGPTYRMRRESVYQGGGRLDGGDPADGHPDGAAAPHGDGHAAAGGERSGTGEDAPAGDGRPEDRPGGAGGPLRDPLSSAETPAP